MISVALRVHLYVLMTAYTLIGATLFFAPSWGATHFAWKISPFIAMTIGGWYLGNAWLALTIARRVRWPLVLCPMLYLSLFGLFEAGVLIAFRERVLVATPLAWLYLITIAATALLAVTALVDAWRQPSLVTPIGAPTRAVTLGLTIAFILFVGFLGSYGLLAVPGMRGLNASIFPEQLTPLSLRAFGAFYLALALAVMPLIWARSRANVINHGYAAYGLVVLITVAAFVFIDQFDFVARPTQAIYLGVYLLVGLVVGIYLVRYGTGADRAA